jgi:hypothetical protein
MDHELIFIICKGGGGMRGTLNVWPWGKNGPVLQQPQDWGGNECLVIGDWTTQ